MERIVASPTLPGLRLPSSGRCNDIAERHSHAKKLRESRHLIEGRAIDAERVDVRGNSVRIKTVCEHAARCLERKRALAVADVEADATPARPQHGLLYFALPINRSVGEGPERVRQHIPRPQPVKHLLVARRRMIEMGLQWDANLVG